MFRWFETRIDAFPGRAAGPAAGDAACVLLPTSSSRSGRRSRVLLVAGFLGSLIEVALMAFVGSLVDMMKDARVAAALLRRPRRHRCCGWRSSRSSPGRSSRPRTT